MKCKELMVRRTLFIAISGLLFLGISGCGWLPLRPGDVSPLGRDTQELSSSFVIEGPNSVPFQLFNVISPGTIRAEIVWEGEIEELTVSLTGRRRPELSSPTALYATATGPSPIRLSYDVTEKDLARGVGWRLIISQRDGAGSAKGSVRILVPSDARLRRAFQREKVALRSGDLWPSATLQGRFMSDLAATTKKGLHAIISLKRALTCDEARQLERLGLIRQSFLAGRNSYGFVRKDINLKHPLIVDVLRHITPLEPEDKVDPHVLLGNYQRFIVTQPGEPKKNYLLNVDGSLQLSVLFAEDVSTERIQAILRAEAVEFSSVTDALWTCRLHPAKLTALAGHDEAEWIEAGPLPPLPENSTTRPFIGVDAVQNANINVGAGTIAYTGLTGAGITIGVDDSGIDANHPDLNVVADRPARGTHGHHVAGIIAGSGAQSNQNDANGNPNNGTPFQWRGMAPDGALIDSDDLVNAANLLSAIQNSSLDLTNRSEAVSPDGDYSAENRTIDQEIRGGTTSGGVSVPRRLQVYSAGNGGTNAQYGTQWDYFATTKQIKNALVVGNWDARPGSNDLDDGSSLGPAYDGRIMPDLVAPGEGVISTGTIGDGVCCPVGTDNTNGYDDCSGTSMSAAATSGVVALLLEAWQTEYSTPHGTTIDATPPLPSTLRALLIQTAQDVIDNNVRNGTSNEVDADSNPGNGIAPGNPTATAGPDFATGWGIIDAQEAVELIEDWRLVNGKRVPNRIIQDATNQGGSVEYDFVVDQVGPLQVTLAWDDVEAATQNPATSPRLVNDLDLELEDPNGTIVYPWQLGQEIQDVNGNVLADNAQPPGTNIQVDIPIQPGTGAGGGDYIPANALAAGGDWVAGQGKDHLNNVEQVFLQNVQPNQIGHWTIRVLGFDVRDGAQDYSVVGFPYPDLAELVVMCTAKVGLSLNTPIQFTWTVQNTGPVASGAPGQTFDYQVWLSQNFFLDASDVALTDANQTPLGPLGPNASVQHTSSVTITQANADALLGPGTTLQDLIDADIFLLIQVDSNHAVLEHNEANVTFVQLARLADVALVLDRSGSMGGEVPVSSGTQRKIDILKDSANLFLDLIRKGAGDELAEISFSGGMGANSVTTDFGPSGLTAITTGNVGQARAAIAALEPGLTTDIRGGLQRGLDVLTAGTATGHRRVLIFFSDGMKTAGGDPTETPFLQQFDNNDVHVYSVGFGTEGGTAHTGIDVPLLQALTNANSGEPGFFHVTESAVALDKFFVNAVAGAMDATVVVDPEADIASGATHTVSGFLGQQDLEATFVLTWDNPDAELGLLVRSPSGLEISETNASVFGGDVSFVEAPAYKLLTVELPLEVGANKHQTGQWEMAISNHWHSTVRYAASIMAESTIRAHAGSPLPAGSSIHMTKAPIPIVTTITGLGGFPLAGAATSVTVNVPLMSLGTLLASAKITPGELSEIPREIHGDPLSQEERLYLALQRRVRKTNLLPRTDRGPFELAEEREPGEYTGTFPDTRIEGIYSFQVRLDGLAPDCQPFQRELSWAVSVEPDPDPQVTHLDVGWRDPTDPQGGITVTATPIVAGGEFLGPGHSSDISIEIDGVRERETAIVDALDGSYVREFTISGRGVAAVRVEVMGVGLPPVILDMGLPSVVAVRPAGGRNDAAQSVVVSLSEYGDAGHVTGVSLVAGQIVVPLSGVVVHAERRIVSGTVPPRLTPGLYRVQLEGEAGHGPHSRGVTYRVAGRGKDVPVGVSRLTEGAHNLMKAATRADVASELAGLLRQLRAIPAGPSLTDESRRAAVDQAIGLLGEGRERVRQDDFPAVLSAVNGGRIDARFVPTAPVRTPEGEGVRVALGNGVSVTFGEVIASGETKVNLLEGPIKIPEERRGSPHVTYDITTTARFDSTQFVDIEIEYEDGDFDDESLLRILHLEENQWVDRTVGLDTENNLILARVNSLFFFVIAAGKDDQ
ncbi:MAG: hypothetical protein AMS16_00420 [Planctomycetes bacterium DG_58]|nr:MAG: hypothetical protein AMS16_00420 [Planctomycetes bacterium DG_58]